MFSQPAATAARAASARGFTLTEIVVVVIIVGIAAAVVIPNAMNTTDLQALSAARTLVADLQYAQDTAITTQGTVTVIFQTTQERYRLKNASATLIHPITKEPYQVDFCAMRGFRDVNIVSASFGGVSWVTFDEMGTPSSAGTVVLRAGPHVFTVNVAAVTGTVTATRS